MRAIETSRRPALDVTGLTGGFKFGLMPFYSSLLLLSVGDGKRSLGRLPQGNYGAICTSGRLGHSLLRKGKWGILGVEKA